MDLSLKESVLPSKNELREHYLRVRKKLTSDFVIKASLEISEMLFRVPEFSEAKIIHCYVSMEKNNEVITDYIIRQCLMVGKKVVVPKVTGSNRLTHHRIDSLLNLEPNGWGVREPVSSEEWPVSAFDAVIVPMVSGDRYYNRIGYGKGYYDRFLKKIHCPKIGLLFGCQLHQSRLPADSCDVPLDQLITENERI